MSKVLKYVAHGMANLNFVAFGVTLCRAPTRATIHPIIYLFIGLAWTIWAIERGEQNE